MKRVSNLLMTLATLLLITVSCQQQETYTPYSDGKVTFQVSLPDLATKAVGDESSVNMLYYEVYEGEDASGALVIDGTKEFMSGQTTSVEFELINDQPYTVIFWADHADGTESMYYNTTNLKQVSFKEGVAVNSNAADREAFYKVVKIVNVEALTSADTGVKLVRPFAQLNIGTENPTYTGAGTDNKLAPVSSKVTVTGLATTFNPLSGKGGDAVDGVVFEKNNVIDANIEVSGKPYDLAAMNYLFVPDGEATATVEYTLTLNNAAATVVTNTIKNVPFKTNYRTNIVGNLLTSNTKYDITIDTKFGGVYDPMDILEHALENGGEVSLFSDMTLAENFTIAANKAVTINLNGNTLNVQNTCTVEGNLTISGGDIKADVNGESDLNYVFYAKDGSTITFDDANINAADGNATVMVNGTESTVNVNNTTITSVGNGGGIYSFFGGDLTLNVTNSKLDGDYAVYIMMAEAVVTVDGNSNIDKFQVASSSKVDVVYEGERPEVTEDGTTNTITYYSKNQFALKEVLENSGTMTLDSDFTLDAAIEIEAGKDVTIDMNGNTFNIESINDLAGNLTLENGTINVQIPGSGMKGAFKPTENGHVTVENANVTVARGNALVAIYNEPRDAMNAVIDVKNSTITVEQGGNGIDIPFNVNYVELNLENSNIYGPYGFLVNETITNALITLDENSSIENINIGGGNVTIVYEGEKPTVNGGNVTYYTKAVYDFNQALQDGTASELTLVKNEDYGTITVNELKNVTITGAEGAKMRLVTDAESNIENVTLKNVGFNFTTGAGQTGGAFVVINKDAVINNLVIDGCTITGDEKKSSYGIYGQNPNASIVVKNCNFSNLGYAIQAISEGGYKNLTVENCTFNNIISWAIMPQYGTYAGNLTVNNCTFTNSGGGLIKSGALTAGHTFTFTNNIITQCTGHDGKDSKWFEFNTSAGTKVISGNTKDNTAWTPGEAEGLK